MTRGLRTVALGAALCALAGCGVRPTGVVNAGEAPKATATSLPHAQVYFLLDGRPTPVTRTVAPWDTQAVFDALLAGPTAQERERGLRTELTPDMTIRVIGSRAVFVESTAFAKQAMPGYFQVYCTALLLPGAPIVRMPGDPGQFQADLKQKLAAGANICPGADPQSGANGLPPVSDETPTPTPDWPFAKETPGAADSARVKQPPPVIGSDGHPVKTARPRVKPSRSG
ncbi:hypothetical protein [Actinoallomurus sp. NPDC050550]|uniref:hypothetical protein n=1 Tax=Actinoallomurus sp. NPDC050550 TaxID=3154937 RepID=UPI0033E69F68